MKTLVVYDSLYGNTEKIAHAIGDAFESEIKVVSVSKINNSDLENIGLLIVGSPTHGGRPSKAIKDFLNNISEKFLKNISVAAFDTRISKEGRGLFIRTIINIFGNAANHIADNLKKKGRNLIIEPKGFFVQGKEGPLKDGELALATN